MSPKDYDGSWAEAKAEWFDEHIGNTTVLADCAYRKAAKSMKITNLVTPTPETEEEWDSDSDMPHPSDNVKKVNRKIRRARARVEPAINLLGGVYGALRTPWFESAEQQGYAVRIAAAIHNERVNSRIRRNT